MDIKQSTIIISGGANGLGRIIAAGLSQKAKQCIVIDIDKEAIKQLEKRHNNIIGYECDVTKFESLAECVKKIVLSHTVDIVVNNAGFVCNAPLISILDSLHVHKQLDNWHRTIATNLDATFYVSSLFAQQWADTRSPGLLINISSIAAQGNIGQAAYSASKAGVEALTVTASKELSMFGIRCAAIAPGFFDAGSTHNALSEPQISKWSTQVPLSRLGQPNEILQAIEFVIANDYFNGRVLRLDGGLRI